MYDRRQFLGAIGLPAAAVACAGVRPELLPPGLLEGEGGGPDDEDFWFEVGRAFTVDRTLVNFNNGGVSPSPAFVQDAMKRHLDYLQRGAERTPCGASSNHSARRVRKRARQGAWQRRQRRRSHFTRNSSESLQICQFGIRPEAAGDRDPHHRRRTIRGWSTTFKQRERARRARAEVQFPLPVPCRRRRRGGAARFERAYHAAHQADPLVPHDQPDRPDPAGAGSVVADGAEEAASR